MTDDKRILVQVDNFRSEDRAIKDSYLSVKYSTETEQYIKKHIDTSFCESKVWYHESLAALSERLPADATFEEYIKNDSLQISAGIAVKESIFKSRAQSEEAVRNIAKCCGAKYLSIKAVVVKDSEYEAISESEALNKVVDGDFVQCIRFTRQAGIEEL